MMIPKKPFLVWFLIVTLVLLGAMIAGRFDSYTKIDEMDATKLSFVILGVCALMTIYCGILTWKASGVIDEPLAESRLDTLKKVRNNSEHVGFASELCQALGLLGTICGLIMMLYSGKFPTGQNVNPESIGLLLQSMKDSMGTAFVSTLVGLVCSMILSFQEHNLKHSIKAAGVDDG